MTKNDRKPCLYTIPSGLSFVDVLAQGIFEKAGPDPLSLARMQILLPTRRACRSLREAFLRITDGKSLLLPRMTPIGDIDEEELSLNLSGMEEDFSIPPAISALQRQFLLTKLIGAMEDKSHGIERDLALASALTRLMDQIHTEDLSLKDLPALVDDSGLAEHWQISVKFLEILSEHWPKILEDNGVIEAADRRNRLLKKATEFWSKNPPDHPVIAAGSTGSIPATAAFLKTVASLPQGCVVLPGLDQAMDEKSWKLMDDTHPQATLRQLLLTLGVERKDVAIWDGVKATARDREKMRLLTTEIMRPADTTHEWQTIQTRLPVTPEDFNIQRYDCAAPQEEALVIALALRATLQQKGKTAALVTPDRKLARRVAMACRRWNIEIDDSGGQALSDTKAGSYLRLCIEAVRGEMKPVALLNFCKHALCLPPPVKDWRGDIRSLDKYLCRGPSFRGGIKAYEAKLQKLKDRSLNTDDLEKTIRFVDSAFAPLLNLAEDKKPKPFSQWCEAHLKVAEFFCDPANLWVHQDGDAAALYFSDLKDQSQYLPPVTVEDYIAVLEQTMKTIPVRPTFGLHPRLMILGQLEARLVEADLMILSGLNEKTWPPDAGEDPWMSRPMRKNFGLPSLERSIGLSAHDFAQALCAKEVILTRSLHVDGTPTVPSRWLQRMDTVLKASGLFPSDALRGPYLDWARKLDHTGDYKPWERPEPRPAVKDRPRKLSVTKIENWMKDPYGIYAQYILGLKKLKPLEQLLDAAMRGDLIHKVLFRFIDKYKTHISEGAQADFMKIVRDELETLGLEDDIVAFWTPRLAKTADWLITHEKAWRHDMLPAKLEVEGRKIFSGPEGDFTLTAKADRIDVSSDGTTSAIIDYKSGGGFSQKGMVSGKTPQLPLEMLILEDGGFDSMKPVAVSKLAYLIVNGGGDGGKPVELSDPQKIETARINAQEGLEKLIAAFDDVNTPYYSLPRPEIAPKSEYNDYEHLARVREWAALDEQGDGE